MYLAGGEFVSYYPMSIVTHGIALNVTVQSYNGRIDFGLTACRRTLPDVRDLARYMHDAFEELASLTAKVAASNVAPPPPKPAPPTAPVAKKAARKAVVKAPAKVPAKMPTKIATKAGAPRSRKRAVA